MFKARTADRVLVALGALLVVASLVAIPFGGGDPRAAGGEAGRPAASTKTDRVAIKGFEYLPPDATVRAGTKLTFTNSDTAEHTATSRQSGVFDTGSLGKGGRRSVSLSEPGTYEYFCEFHPFMKGKVVVE